MSVQSEGGSFPSEIIEDADCSRALHSNRPTKRIDTFKQDRWTLRIYFRYL